MFSQLSQRTTRNVQKVVFKISYKNECKLIPQEREINFNDIISKCRKGFSIDQELALSSSDLSRPNHHVLTHHDESTGQRLHIANQTQLNKFLEDFLGQSQRSIKLTLSECRGVAEQQQQQSSDLLSTAETIKISDQIAKQNQPEVIQSMLHSVNPLLVLKILQQIKNKGSVSVKDVKKINLENKSLGEKLEKLTNLESLDILSYCE